MELPVEFRETVVLCELEELSYEQAARLLECPIGTIRSRLHRGARCCSPNWKCFAMPRGAGDRWDESYEPKYADELPGVEILGLDSSHDASLGGEVRQRAAHHVWSCAKCAALRDSWNEAQSDLAAFADSTQAVGVPARIETRVLQQFRVRHQSRQEQKTTRLAGRLLAAARSSTVHRKCLELAEVASGLDRKCPVRCWRRANRKPRFRERWR